jgi:hypothetical protein
MERARNIIQIGSNIATDLSAYCIHTTQFVFGEHSKVREERLLDDRRHNDLNRFLDRTSAGATPVDQQFDYQQLQLPEGRLAIRLMRLLPGKDLDEIRCSLETSSLATATYEALSYFWGDVDLPV